MCGRKQKSQHPAKVTVISIAQPQLPPMDGGATTMKYHRYLALLFFQFKSESTIVIHATHATCHPPLATQKCPRISGGTSLLPAGGIICGCKATRAASPDICHAYACALLQLHVIVCLWSWVVCA